MSVRVERVGFGKMLSFNEQLYIEKAITDQLIASPSEIVDFREGHLKGMQAIRNHYDVRWMRLIRTTEKIHVSLMPNVISRLRSREYDGRTVDGIIRETTLILAERIHLLHEIYNLADKEHILSDDRVYALPYYQDSSTKVLESCVFVPIFNLIKSLKKKPRTRAEIIELLPPEVVGKHGIDIIIQTLVESRAL